MVQTTAIACQSTLVASTSLALDERFEIADKKNPLDSEFTFLVVTRQANVMRTGVAAKGQREKKREIELAS